MCMCVPTEVMVCMCVLTDVDGVCVCSLTDMYW